MKAEFHDKSGKCVLEAVGPSTIRKEIHAKARLSLAACPGKPNVVLQWVDTHKWLGLMWRADLTWKEHP